MLWKCSKEVVITCKGGRERDIFVQNEALKNENSFARLSDIDLMEAVLKSDKIKKKNENRYRQYFRQNLCQNFLKKGFEKPCKRGREKLENTHFPVSFSKWSDLLEVINTTVLYLSCKLKPSFLIN